MVSPSKKGKLKSKVRDSVAGHSRPSTTGLCQLTRGSKPLIGKKFYLDVKNHVISSRLEANLKSLGAAVEIFLVKEVDYVVSDRPEWTQEGKVAAGSGTGGSGINGPQSGCGSLTPRFSSLSTPAGGTGSESPGTLDSPKEAAGKRRVKTRAEAMLVSARQQKQQTTIDPLENARSWRIPIWPVENVFKWIKKIQGSLLLKRPESRNKPVKPVNKFKELRTPYVKLETLDTESRPTYKELPAWPELNLDCPPGGCPFSVSKTTIEKPVPKDLEKEEKKNESSGSSGPHDKKLSKRMTRKARPVRPSKEGLRAGAAAGYCEICRGDYSDLGKHLKTESHAKYAGNDKNFLALDKLINKGPNVDGFLKMNGAKSCSELFGTRRTTRSGMNIHRTWSLDNELTLWKPDDKEDVQESKDETDDITRRLLVPNGHHNNIQKNLDNHFLHSPKRSRLRLSMDERVTKYGKKDQSVEVVCNGFPDNIQLPPVLKQGVKSDQDHSLRKVTHSSKESSPSCQQSRDTGHHLRSRLVPTSEDNSNSSDLHLRQRRPRSQIEEIPDVGVTPLSPVNKDSDENTKNNGKLCSGVGFRMASTLGESSSKVVVVRRKRLSVEERLLEDNRGQYGKELVPAKLRSSGYYSVKKETQEIDSASVSSVPPGESSVSKEASGWNGVLPESENIVVKPRRAKRTELSLLSVEAESFMFGESVSKDGENCVPGESVRSERLSTVLELRECRVVNKFSKGEPLSQNCRTSEDKKDEDPEAEIDSKSDVAHCDDSSLASDTYDGDKIDDDHFHRRKRRTHAEVFIHDNLDYYKFEISEQRLRHGENKDEKEEKETVLEEVAVKEEAELSFAATVEEDISIAPCEAVELKKSANDSEVVKFSFESIPFSEPWYQTYQRQDEGEEIHFTSFSDASAFKPFSLPYESHIDVISKFGFKRTGFQRKRCSGVGKNARKSPRCHASTLAIMSSLMAKRRKESKTQKPATEKPVKRISLPSGSNSDFKSDSDKEMQDIAKSIEVMLDVNCKDDEDVKLEDSNPVKVPADKSAKVQLEDLELDLKHLICEDELINYAVNDAVPDVVSLLDSFPDCDCVGLSEEERGAINEAYERGICELKERLNPVPATGKPRGMPGRPRKREPEEQEVHMDNMDYDSASETASTCGTVSEVGSHTCKISRKKKRRNRTGWPRQLPKRKKIDFTTSIDPVDSPVVPVRVPGRRGRPRKYPPKEDCVSTKNMDSSVSIVNEEKDLKCTKMSTRQSNKDVLLACTSSSGKLSEGPTLRENLVNACKSSGGDNSLRPSSSPNYSSRNERVGSNRLSMTSPENGLRKFSSLARRKLINQNRRESPRKVKPQLGMKWDVWSIRKRR